MAHKLTLDDTLALARIIDKGNMTETFEEFANNVVDGKIANDKAIKFFMGTLVKLSSKEVIVEVYEFLGNVFEMEPDAVKCMELSDFGKKFKEIAKENNIGNFLQGLQTLMH